MLFIYYLIISKNRYLEYILRSEMSKELKDLIDKAEEEQASRAFLEKTVDRLKAEVATLNKKLGEKRTEFKVEPVRHVEEAETDTSKEISVLKNAVTSLKQELIQKERDKKLLQTQLSELKIEFEKVRDEMLNSSKDDMIIKTQNSLNTLIQDYSKLENENKSLKMKISALQEEMEGKSVIATDLQSEKFNKVQLEKEVGNLKSKIHELESKNESFIREIKNLKAQGDSKNMEQMIAMLKSNNFELEMENKNLAQKLENLKREKLKVQKYESEIAELKSQIDQLKDLNQELKDKGSILLAKTITAMSASDRRKSISDAPPEPRSETDVKPETDIRIQESIQSTTTKELKQPEIEVEIIKETTNLEKVPDETEDGSIARKWQCPQCGNTNKAQIREQDDKTHVIYTYPKIYGKKYTCGQCGKEWR